MGADDAVFYTPPSRLGGLWTRETTLKTHDRCKVRESSHFVFVFVMTSDIDDAR